MSDAIKKLRDYLAKSPSVVYPQDVLAYLPAIEAENAKLRKENKRLIIKLNAERIVRQNAVFENAKLRELLKAAYRCTNAGPSCLECRMVAGGCTLLSAMRELGVDVP